MKYGSKHENANLKTKQYWKIPWRDIIHSIQNIILCLGLSTGFCIEIISTSLLRKWCAILQYICMELTCCPFEGKNIVFQSKYYELPFGTGTVYRHMLISSKLYCDYEKRKSRNVHICNLTCVRDPCKSFFSTIPPVYDWGQCHFIHICIPNH